MPFSLEKLHVIKSEGCGATVCSGDGTEVCEVPCLTKYMEGYECVEVDPLQTPKRKHECIGELINAFAVPSEKNMEARVVLNCRQGAYLHTIKSNEGVVRVDCTTLASYKKYSDRIKGAGLMGECMQYIFTISCRGILCLFLRDGRSVKYTTWDFYGIKNVRSAIARDDGRLEVDADLCRHPDTGYKAFCGYLCVYKPANSHVRFIEARPKGDKVASQYLWKYPSF